jgi:CHASE2 domain-containing sensor protein
MNSRYAGKSFPDMYGIVIHANIISMMLHENYINSTSAFMKYFLVVLVSLLNVLVLLQLKKRLQIWASAATKGWLLIQSIFFLFLTVYAFEIYSFKIDLTAAALGIFLTTTSIEVYEIFLEKILHRKMQRK